jgi:hypothetical protein
VRSLAGPITLIAARARRRPGRWLLTALGVALAVAFAGAVAGEATIAGDQGARSVLEGLTSLDRAVRVTWQGFATPAVAREARTLLGGLGLGPQTEVVLLAPVRLSGVVVHPAAIAPLGRWTSAVMGRRAGRCRSRSCPMLLAGGSVPTRVLSALGVRVIVAGTAMLHSAAPLGFTPAASGSRPPVLLSGDPAGLGAVAGLDGVYRTHSWFAELEPASLHSWQLATVERRLQRAQAALTASGSQFTMTAPFAGLDGARAQSHAAPRRLLLAGGGAVAVLAAFVILAAGGLRRDQRAEVERLLASGARTGQCAAFVLGEAAALCAVALIVGAALALAATALLASAAAVPVRGVLTHSLLTPAGGSALIGGWIGATALVGLVLLLPARPVADVLAVAAAASLALALSRGTGAADSLAPLVAPLCSLAAGVLTFRVAAVLLRGGERAARRGPVLARLALVSLARAPGAPALAIAFIAVSTGFGAFALAYRSTLLRGTADQAAAQVPLDVTVSPAADFTTPLEGASLSRWRGLAGGPVVAVRRTDAAFASGTGTVTVPALGVPAGALALMHGWRAGDGSAPLPVLARRLTPSGPSRVPGPVLARSARSLSLRLSVRAAVTVTAELRAGSGAVFPLTLRAASPGAGTVTARLPPGSWELEALELSEPTGLEATNGHQIAENPAAATQSTTTVALGPLRALDGGSAMTVPIGGWPAVGAASVIHRWAHRMMIRFANNGQPGVLRPAQPSDSRPVPVLADPQAAAASTGTGRIALTVDGLPVPARVVGVLRRFPTLPAGAGGFVIADQATLASALDAQLPGQGRPDELWIATAHAGRLRSALRAGPLAGFGAAFRGDIASRLRSAPIARAVLGTLVAATAVAGALAVLGLLVALLGGARDPRLEDDLRGQGVGPRGLRRELRLRLVISGVTGVCAGLAIGLVLTRLAVAAVSAAATIAVPRPPLVTVAPWGELAVWGLAAVGALALASVIATRMLAPGGSMP